MPEDVAYLRTTRAVRERAGALFERGVAGELAHFRVDLGALDAVVARVERTTLAQYPTLDVPLHARFRHFGAARLAELDRALAGRSAVERAAAKVDLVVTSVLLDAGAGPAWRYRDADGATYARSEGLAVASFRMFMDGAFSADPARDPLRADGLAGLTEAALARGFQVSADNPLVGVAGRAALLAALGRLGRPAALLPVGRDVTAPELLLAVLERMGPIWSGRVVVDGVNLGDVWPHPAVGLVPFHKLSQWLTYSLVEPLEEAGAKVTGIEGLTGLPEYRNGGLFLDGGVLVLRDPAAAAVAHAPGAPLVVEWRALTVALLDRVADAMRARLGKSAAELPLAKVLEGGTWAAGRAIAAEKRPGGAPPLTLDSDGTVF